MIEIIKAALLGIVEGVTEFLPISSTGHLLVASELLDFGGSLDGTFEIFIQLGALVAVVGYYRADLARQVKSVSHDHDVQCFWLHIVVAVIPAGFIGLLARAWIKDALFAPLVIAAALIVGGLLFLLVERRFARQAAPIDAPLYAITFKQALVIGLIQSLALAPGVSRSGASILGGMLVGLPRRTATQFSFYLALPTLGGATLVELLASLDQIERGDVLLLAVGTLLSAIVGWAAIDWLLRYVSRNNFVPFGYYRILAGLIIGALVVVGVL